MAKETCQPKKNCKITGTNNIKVCKQNTKKEKQRKGLMHIQTKTKSKAKTLNKKNRTMATTEQNERGKQKRK